MLIKHPDDVSRRTSRHARSSATGGGSCAIPPASPPRRCSAPAASRCSGTRAGPGARKPTRTQKGQKLEGVVESIYRTDEELTPYSDITGYNNFYEFGTDKRDPARYAGGFTPRPWTVKVLGNARSRVSTATRTS